MPQKVTIGGFLLTPDGRRLRRAGFALRRFTPPGGTTTTTTTVPITTTTTTAPAGQRITGQDLPFAVSDMYVDGVVSADLGELIDGDTDNFKYFKPNGDQVPVRMPITLVVDLERYNATLENVRIYDGAGGGAPMNTEVIVIRSDNQPVSLGIYDGSGYGSYNVKSPGAPLVAKRVLLKTTNVGNDKIYWGSQLKIKADYNTPTPPVLAPLTPKKIRGLMGVNTYWWQIFQRNSGTNLGLHYATLDAMGIDSIRLYADALRYVQLVPDKYSFHPVTDKTPTGIAWYEENLHNDLKANHPGKVAWGAMQGTFPYIARTWQDVTRQFSGTIVTKNSDSVTINVTSKTGTGNELWSWQIELTSTPAAGKTAIDYWMQPEYGVQVQFHNVAIGQNITISNIYLNENWQVGNGIKFIYDKLSALNHRQHINYRLEDAPNEERVKVDTWLDVGRLAFYTALRRGAVATGPNYAVGTANTVQKGLNLPTVFEGGNEWDTHWEGTDGYILAVEMAAAMSMMYDGHKGAYTNCGVKQADPNFKVMNPGLASAKIDVWKAFKDWCIENRGLRTDAYAGYVDLPIDIINVHAYSHANGSNQYGSGASVAFPPEIGAFLSDLKALVDWKRQFAPWCELWCTEWGLDIDQESPMGVRPFSAGGYTVEQIRAWWTVRSILGMAAVGVDKAQWFRLLMDHPDNGRRTDLLIQFNTMSLIKEEPYGGSGHSYRVVGDYFRQLKQYREFEFQAQLSASPRVLKFKNGNQVLIAYWTIEAQGTTTETRYNYASDGITPTSSYQVSVAQFTETTGTYALPVPNGVAYAIHQFQDSGPTMNTSGGTSNGTVNLTCNSKPKLLTYSET